MTSQDALKKIKKILGPKMAWRDNGRHTSPEQRAEAEARRIAAKTTRDAAAAALAARREELLKDAEYIRLREVFQVAQNDERHSGAGGGYRLTVGIDMGFALEVKAQGDNWSEIVRALESRTPGQLTSARVS